MAVAVPQRWQTRVENDFHLGIIRDSPRVGIPAGGLYDCRDGFVHRPGVIFKRGGVSFAGPAMTDATYGVALAYAPFPSGPKLVALGDNGNCYTVTSGATTKIASDSSTCVPIDKPTFFSSGAQSILIFCDKDGTRVPIYYDGQVTSTSHAFTGGATNIVTGEQVANQLTLHLANSPSSGTFRLAISLQPSGDVSPLLFITASINYNASAANVKTAIDNALASTGVTSSTSGGALPGADVVITMPVGYTIQPWVSALNNSGYPVVTNTTSSSSTTDPVSVPYGRFSEVFLQRLVLANSATYPSRLWFSPVLNITGTGWDLANSWIDVGAPITGLAAMSGELIVFTDSGKYRLTGTIPPGEPNSDMFLEQMSEIGCTDARSITISEGRVVWANPSGVYMSAGVSPVPLMEDRIESYWQGLFSGYVDPLSSGTTWTIATGIRARRFLLVSVKNGSTVVENLCCDLKHNAWTFLGTNLNPTMYASAVGVVDDLYFVNDTNNRVISSSGMLTPSSSNKNDVGMTSAETATAVTPSWTLRPLGAGVGLKAFGDGEVLLDMRDASSDNPTLAVTVAPGVEATTATAVAESPLAETTDLARKRVTVSKDSEAVTVAFTQSNASSKTEFYGLEWNERPYGAWAEGQ